MTNNLTYAIDFGTSNSLLAAADENQVYSAINLDPSSEDSTILRSLIYFSEDSEVFYGQEAIQEFIKEDGAGRFLRSIKKYLPQKSFTGTRIGNKHYKIENLISKFLKEMKLRADTHFNQDVTKLVLGRPAKFSMDAEEENLAEERLMSAARLAGFKDIDFLPEPIAAAFDYKQQIEKEKIVLVVDLGGGTSDFTVVKVRKGPFKDQDVLSIGGLSVAGNSLDSRIMSQVIAPHFGSEVSYKLPFSTSIKSMPSSLKYDICSPAAITLLERSNIFPLIDSIKKSSVSADSLNKLNQLQSLIYHNLGFQIFEQIENTKVDLCNSKLNANFVFQDEEIDVQENIDYKKFKEITKLQVESILDCMDDVIKSSGVRPSEIDLICCTGGTSRVPEIQHGLLTRFGKERIQSFKNFHSVIQGLAEKAKQNLNS